LDKNKVALITGITGQDGSYLAEFLLKKGYIVHGIKRRTSLFNTDRIDHLYQDPHIENRNFILHFGDMTDSMNITKIIQEVQPDEIYNLAAMSHVAVSFETPEYVANADGTGTLRILEAVKLLGLTKKTKIYQASTSELYGKVQETPQSETTPFYPRSPYAVAKMYAYWITVNYREAYGMFASNGILFNHESVPKNSPLILKQDEQIEILPIEDMFRTEKHRYEGILNKYEDSLVWNGEDWTKVIAGTSYQDKNKKLKLVQTRESSYEATDDHIAFNENNEEIATKDWKVQDRVFKVKFPENMEEIHGDIISATLFGSIVANGDIDEKGQIKLTCLDTNSFMEIDNFLMSQFYWSYTVAREENIWKLSINNNSDYGLWLKENIYTSYSKEKRVPQFILNSIKEVKKAFFDAYYLANNLKERKETYQYKGWTTNSATLSLGLSYIFRSFSNQVIKTKTEYRDGKRYYYTQLRADEVSGQKGTHLKKTLNEIISISETESEDGWFFDIQTESETFATGSNLFKIHNSPVRGETFVTRKITRAVSKIALGLQDKLYLGNLNAKRDWGHAKDFVKMMWMILQADEPEDWVIATGKTTTVRDFVKFSFQYIGVELEFKGQGVDEKAYVKSCSNPDYQIKIGKEVLAVDSRYFRPTEVDLLLGDPTKAEQKLGWKREFNLQDLVNDMMESDLKLMKRDLHIKEGGYKVMSYFE